MEYIDLLGKEFQYGGVGPDYYDCKGLVNELYKRLNINFPNYNSPKCIQDQHNLFQHGLENYTEQIEKPEPNCLVTFKIRPPYVSHIGMVMPDCRSFIHILAQSKVTVERLDSIMWANKIAGYYRLLHE